MKRIFSRIKQFAKSDNFVAKGLVLAILITLIAVPGVWGYFYRTDGTTTFGYGYGYGYFSSGYGYGYGYGYGTGTDWAHYGHTPVEETPDTIAVSSIGTDTATVSWATDYFSTGRVEYGGDTTYGSTATSTTFATSHSVELTSLACGMTYHYKVVAIDSGSFEFESSDGTFDTSACAGGGTSGGSATLTTSDTTETAEEVAEEAVEEVEVAEEAVTVEPVSEAVEPVTAQETVPAKPEQRDTAKEADALGDTIELLGKLPQTAAEWKVNDFIAYGATAPSQKATQYERMRLIQDYKTIFGKVPEKATEWQDIHNIQSGKRTVNRNIAREADALKTFAKIYKRLPASKGEEKSDTYDWWAVHYMTYGIRMPSRNLDTERFAISVYKGIFGDYPSTGDDWNVMRAIAYSGASK